MDNSAYKKSHNNSKDKLRSYENDNDANSIVNRSYGLWKIR